MSKKITSFSLEETTLELLKKLAEKSDRSQAKMLEHLIKEAAQKANLVPNH
jgi:predicted DNA-binding ribbon-helix-helix protein